jgi:predicted nucleic acid-binding protein
MRVLLDTNILIHREASTVVRRDIGNVFFWLDKLRYDKIAHPVSITEIAKHQDEKVRNTFRAKLQSYNILKTTAPLSSQAQQFASTDKSDNDRNDTIILNEVFANRVDLLITEDRGVHGKAGILGIADRVFTIDAFLEKVSAENPNLVDYKVLSVKKSVFGSVDIASAFFDTFRADYGGAEFDKWFARKADETAYVCYEAQDIVAFLYVKPEGCGENYSDILPLFAPKRRLKIGTLKVEMNGYKLGERLLKIIFDNALRQRAEEIYVTIFQRTPDQERLIRLLQEFGFTEYGTKTGSHGTELVLVRNMRPAFNVAAPALTFPYVSMNTQCYIVPIWPEYHTELLPDSILRNESPTNFVEQFPHRNAIRKVYISRSMNRDVRRGDTIVFYRTTTGSGGYYRSVATTVGVVENMHLKILDVAHFVSLCRKRSVFTDDELVKWWDYKKHNRPFIVEFLYAYSFTKRPNLKELIDNGVIRDVSSAPRGFEPLSMEQFNKVLSLAQADQGGVVS